MKEDNKTEIEITKVLGIDAKGLEFLIIFALVCFFPILLLVAIPWIIFRVRKHIWELCKWLLKHLSIYATTIVGVGLLLFFIVFIIQQISQGTNSKIYQNYFETPIYNNNHDYNNPTINTIPNQKPSQTLPWFEALPKDTDPTPWEDEWKDIN